MHALQRIGSALLTSLALAAGTVVGTAHAASSNAAKAAAQTAAQTRYPIVLVHGFMGFDSLLGVDYWYQIPGALRKAGATVYVAEVSQVNSNTVRGEQLLQQIQGWASKDGFKKVNLIGHSQGGPTARYVAGVAPSLVASITTVGSPHTISADDAANNPVGDLISKQPKFTIALAKLVAFLSGNSSTPQDITAFNGNFADELAAFNLKYPLGLPTTPCGEGPEMAAGIALYSITGNQGKTNAWDISDAVLLDQPDSDGIVPRCSTHFGKVLRDDYPWNHLDEVNQVLGLVGKGAPDPVAFYVQQAARLKAKGL